MEPRIACRCDGNHTTPYGVSNDRRPARAVRGRPTAGVGEDQTRERPYLRVPTPARCSATHSRPATTNT